MKKLLLLGLFLIFAAACDKSRGVIRCGDYDVKLINTGDTLNAELNGDLVALYRVVSASGEKYAGTLNETNIIFWGKGSDWMMILDEGAPIECK